MLIALLHRLWKRLDRQATEHLTERQLRHLDPHLLRDIGLVRDGNRIRPIDGILVTPATEVLPPRSEATDRPDVVPDGLPQGEGG